MTRLPTCGSGMSPVRDSRTRSGVRAGAVSRKVTRSSVTRIRSRAERSISTTRPSMGP